MNGFRVGFSDPTINTRYGPDALLRVNYLTAVANRVDSFWLGDHLNGVFPASLWTPRHLGVTRLAPHGDAVTEPWTMLGHLAGRSRLARLRLGIGVTDAGRRHPAVTAQAAATLHLLTRGRAILGIGPGERGANEPYGVDWTAPVTRFEEAVATIRALWESDGRLVDRDSAHFPLRNAVFALPPYRGSRPEIWVGAHGPRMLRATGRYGDAWYPAFPQRPQDYERRLEVVRAAASDAGRDPMSILPALFILVYTGRDRAEVDEGLSSHIAKWLGVCASADMWRRHGATHPLGPDFAGMQDLIPQTVDEHTALSYTTQVPDGLMRELCLHGTPAEVLEQAAEWRDRGVRYLIVANASTLRPNLRIGIAAGLPFARILRGLRKL